jgi:hypothetical protein
MELEYIGVINGMKTWLVKNEAGEVIGKNETPEHLEEGVE